MPLSVFQATPICGILSNMHTKFTWQPPQYVVVYSLPAYYAPHVLPRCKGKKLVKQAYSTEMVFPLDQANCYAEYCQSREIRS